MQTALAAFYFGFLDTMGSTRLPQGEGPPLRPTRRFGDLHWKRDDLDESSEGARQWVTRWKYEMTAEALRPGIWGPEGRGLRPGNRVLDPRSGAFVEYQRVLRDVTLSQVEQARFRLRSDTEDLAAGASSRGRSELIHGAAVRGKCK